MTLLMLASALLLTVTVARLSSVLESSTPVETRNDGKPEVDFKAKHEKMQELLKQSEEREKERVKMFNEKEETQKAKNEMFDQRENDLDKMLGMKEKLIDKKERDFEKQTAQMEREQEDADRDSSATDKEDDADSSGGDADDSSFLELVKGSSKWRTDSDATRAEKKFEAMSAAVAKKQARTEEQLRHLNTQLDRRPSSFAQVSELPTFPKEFAKLAEDQTLQNDDEAVQDDQKNVDEKFEELQNTLKQMSPEKAVAEDEARAELDEDEPSSFLELGAKRGADLGYGKAYLELLAHSGVEKHFKDRAAELSDRVKKLSAAADADVSAGNSAFQQMMKDSKAKMDATMKPLKEQDDADAKMWDTMMNKKRTEAAAERLASSFMQERVLTSRGDDDDDDDLKKIEEKAVESAEDIEEIDKKLKSREAAEVKGEHMLDQEIKVHEAKAAKILQSQPDLIGTIEKNLRENGDKDDDTK